MSGGCEKRGATAAERKRERESEVSYTHRAPMLTLLRTERSSAFGALVLAACSGGGERLSVLCSAVHRAALRSSSSSSSQRPTHTRAAASSSARRADTAPQRTTQHSEAVSPLVSTRPVDCSSPSRTDQKRSSAQRTNKQHKSDVECGGSSRKASSEDELIVTTRAHPPRLRGTLQAAHLTVTHAHPPLLRLERSTRLHPIRRNVLLTRTPRRNQPPPTALQSPLLFNSISRHAGSVLVDDAMLHRRRCCRFLCLGSSSALLRFQPQDGVDQRGDSSSPVRSAPLSRSPAELRIVTDEVDSSRSSSSSSSPLPLGACVKVPFSHVRRRPHLLTSLLFLLDYGYS